MELVDAKHAQGRVRSATPDRIDLLRGRWLDANDISLAQPVAVVNETLARTYWKDRNDVVGGRIRVGDMSNPMVTVVGIVADERHNGVTGAVKEKFFIPHSQWHVVTGGNLVRNAFIVVRTTGDPLSVAAAAVRNEVRNLDANIPVANVRLMREAVGAIGADRTQVMVMILKQGMTLAGAGIAVGVVAAFLMSRLMPSLLYQVQPGDPGTFVIVPLVLMVVALLASALPAFRATRVNPLIALRSE